MGRMRGRGRGGNGVGITLNYINCEITREREREEYYQPFYGLIYSSYVPLCGGGGNTLISQKTFHPKAKSKLQPQPASSKKSQGR